MKQPKFYMMIAALVLVGYGSGIAYAANNDALKDQSEYQQMISSKITLVEAIQKAETAHPDMKVSSIEFEEEDDKLVYSVELMNEKGEMDLLVDATTGKITKDD